MNSRQTYGAVKQLFSRFLLITDQKGTDVLRVQTAISDINISNKQLAFYELIPFALLRAGVTQPFDLVDMMGLAFRDMMPER